MRVIYLLFFFFLCFVFNCQAIHFLKEIILRRWKKPKLKTKTCLSASPLPGAALVK